MTHNLAIPSLILITPHHAAGETVGLTVGSAPAGDNPHFCDLPGHEFTMNGILKVVAG